MKFASWRLQVVEGDRGAGARENREREGGGEKAGSGIPKVARTGRKGEKILQYCITFYNRNRTKRQEPLQKGAGRESKRYGRREL